MKKIMIFGGIGLVVVAAIVAVLVLVVFKPSDEEKVEPPKEEILFQFEELYTNIPVGGEEEGYKILKLQMTLVYTDETFGEILTKRTPEVIDFLNGYFRDITTETVNRKNGKERVKEQIVERLVEMFETDSDNFKSVLFTQFIIQ